MQTEQLRQLCHALCPRLARPPDEETTVHTHATKFLMPLACTGLKPHFLDKLAANGVVLPPAFFELETPGLRPALAGGFA